MLRVSAHGRADLREGPHRARLPEGRARDPALLEGARHLREDARPSRRRTAAVRLLRGPAHRQRPAAQRARPHARHQGPLPALQDDARLRASRARPAGTRTGCRSRSRSRRSSGIHGKAAIEEYGVEPFVKKCIESVFRYTQEWEALTERVALLGRPRRRLRHLPPVATSRASGGRSASSRRRASSTRGTRSSGGGRRAARRSAPARSGRVQDRRRPERLRRVPARRTHAAETRRVRFSSGRRRRGPCRRTCTRRSTRRSTTRSSGRATAGASSWREGSSRRWRRSWATCAIERELKGSELVGCAYEPPFDLFAKDARAAIARRRLARHRRRLRHARRGHRHRPHRARLRRGRPRRAPQSSLRDRRRPAALLRRASPTAPFDPRRFERYARSLGQRLRQGDQPRPQGPRPARSRRAVPPRLPLLLARRQRPAHPVRAPRLVHPHARAHIDRAIANNQRGAVAARAHQGRPLRRLPREQRRLGALARALVGHAAQRLGLRSRSGHQDAPTSVAEIEAAEPARVRPLPRGATGRPVPQRAPHRPQAVDRPGHVRLHPRAAARCAGCPRSSTAGSTRAACPSPSGATRTRRARRSASTGASRPTSSARRSTRRAAGSTRCSWSRRSSSTRRAVSRIRTRRASSSGTSATRRARRRAREGQLHAARGHPRQGARWSSPCSTTPRRTRPTRASRSSGARTSRA